MIRGHGMLRLTWFQQSLLGMAVASDVNDEEDHVLTEVFKQCEELRAKKYLEVVKTNRELAKKYGISPRTVTNWRKAGCPFEDGQWAVLDWMAGRRYAPAGARAKFDRQLNERKDRAVWTRLNLEREALVGDARRLKGVYQTNGLKPPIDSADFVRCDSKLQLSQMSSKAGQIPR